MCVGSWILLEKVSCFPQSLLSRRGNDKNFLLDAAKAGKGAAMQGASVALREDRNFVLEMAVHDAEAYHYASEDLLNDKDLGSP